MVNFPNFVLLNGFFNQKARGLQRRGMVGSQVKIMTNNLTLWSIDLTIRLLISTAFLLTYLHCSKQSANQSPIAGLSCLESHYSMGDILGLTGVTRRMGCGLIA